MNDYRKESSFNLGTAETKLLYTLHWILSDAADECSLQAEEEGKLDISTFSYLFPLSAITVITLQQHLTLLVTGDLCPGKSRGGADSAQKFLTALIAPENIDLYHFNA